ncbi:MAG: HRDC domain-containing protein, partial [Chloroflexi bacterium]|nr:HRDC domain-containing protein [Chloroflexota bacterium]
MPDGALVTTEDGVDAVAEAIREAGAFTLDLEFVPENRYVPELGLVQVGWDGGAGIDALEVAAIDPLVVDPSPVLTLVGDPEIETITHAAQGDLQILAHRFSVRARSLRDTQIAAAFLGHGDQIGYAPLVESTLGVHLEKGSQYTEWLRRPLTDEQLVYALDDVRYLGTIWARQRAALVADGRLQPVFEECDRLAHAASNRPPPEEAYRRVKGWSGLRSRPLGALRQLAAWREREALRANRPPSRVLNDRSMLELARAAPTSDDGLRSVRGVEAGMVRRHGAALIRAIREGRDDPPERDQARKPPPPQGGGWGAGPHGLVR